MIKRAIKFNWILEPSKYLTKEEAKKLLETARSRAEAIFTKRRKQLLIRGRIAVISIAPQAAPAIKEATRSPIHENTYP